MPQTTLPSGRTVDLDANPTGSTQGIPSNLPADHPAGWTPAYGGAPEIPDPIAAAWKALGGNVDLLPGLFSLGNAYNLFNYDQRLGQVMGTPGYEGIAANLRGELPQDVVNQLGQRSAERGVAGGFVPDLDNPNTNAAYLRALGLNSLQQQQLGQNQQNALLGLYPQAAPFNLMSGLLSAEDMQAALAAANVSAAAPNPQAAADEDFRKLMAAIEAGKNAAGPGGAPPPGIDYQALINALRSGSGNPNTGPGTVVGRGPNTTVDRGNNFFVPSPVTPFNTTKWTDPGVSGYNAQGIRNDVIKNAGANNYVNSIFATPGFQDAGTLGGLGLDPTLNAVIGGLGNYGNYTDFGAPITSPGISYDMGGNDLFGTNPNHTYFGQPITSHNLYSGAPDSDWLDSIFSTPSYGDYGSVGGYGLDPVLNAILGGGGLNDQSVFGAITPNDRTNFGQPLFPDSGGSYFDSLFGGGSSDDDLYAWLSLGGDEDLFYP